MTDNFNIETIYQEVLTAIETVAINFNNNKALIITESDLKCQLYSELKKILNEESNTHDNAITGTPLHTEIAFYNPNELNKADMPVDIVILDPIRFSILTDPKLIIENGEITNGLPGKQYRSYGDCILIELKFCKLKGGITNSFKESIQKDINKLEKLIAFNSNVNIKGLSLIFNKTNKYCTSFEENILNLRKDNIEVIYKSSNIEF